MFFRLLTLAFKVTAPNEDLLEVRVRTLEHRLSGVGMRGRTAMNNQEEAFLLVGPWAVLDSKIFKMG